jgi:uncharacterized membrane protein YkoI
MTGNAIRALAGALLLASGVVFGVPDGASAQSCLSRDEARAAVQAGQAIPLSRIKRQVEKQADGEIQGQPRLCKDGGQFVYMINVMGPGGQIKRIVVDARSGGILGSGY